MSEMAAQGTDPNTNQGNSIRQSMAKRIPKRITKQVNFIKGNGPYLEKSDCSVTWNIVTPYSSSRERICVWVLLVSQQRKS